jgi:hypothetical protein
MTVVTETERETSYRRGYTQGVEAVLDAIQGQLAPDREMRLRRWWSHELLPWRMAADQGVTQAPVPPAL